MLRRVLVLGVARRPYDLRQHLALAVFERRRQLIAWELADAAALAGGGGFAGTHDTHPSSASRSMPSAAS